jgi:hypothetical protein
MRELKGIMINMEYREGVFHTKKEASLYFSSIEEKNTAERISGSIEAIVKELPKAMKHDYHVQINVYGLDSNYKFVEGFRYCTDNYGRKIEYRKWVESAQIYDISEEVVYEKKHKNGYMVMDTAKMHKDLRQRMLDDAHSLVWQYGRCAYNLSI